MVFELSFIKIDPGKMCVLLNANVHIETPSHTEKLFDNLKKRLEKALGHEVERVTNSIMTGDRREGAPCVSTIIRCEECDETMGEIEKRFRSYNVVV